MRLRHYLLLFATILFIINLLWVYGILDIIEHYTPITHENNNNIHKTNDVGGIVEQKEEDEINGGGKSIMTQKHEKMFREKKRLENKRRQIMTKERNKYYLPFSMDYVKRKKKEGKEGEDLFLTIGIPTIARENNENYLELVYNSILRQLEQITEDNILYKRILFIISQNNDSPLEHLVYLKIKQKISELPEDLKVYFELHDYGRKLEDPYLNLFIEHDERLLNIAQRPNHFVRQQTMDLVSNLELVNHRSHFHLVMEDDFIMCEDSLNQFEAILKKAWYVMPDWRVVRVSYGGGGLIYRTSDLAWLIEYLKKGSLLKPPDILMVQWYTGRNLAYKTVLLEHVGDISTFRGRENRRDFPKCNATLSNIWSLRPFDQFLSECENEILCPYRKSI